MDLLERIGRHEECAVAVEQQRAMLTALHDELARAALEDVLRRLAQVLDTGELTRLLVVDDEEIDLRQQLTERSWLARDPEVHRVGRDEPQPSTASAHLVDDVELELGVDVAQEHVGARLVSRGDLGVEVGEDVELRVERGPRPQVLRVATAPPERLAGHPLDAGCVDASRLQQLEMRGREVVAHDPDDPHVREERRGQRGVGCGPTQHPFEGTRGHLQVVERDGPNNEDRLLAAHGRRLSTAPQKRVPSFWPFGARWRRAELDSACPLGSAQTRIASRRFTYAALRRTTPKWTLRVANRGAFSRLCRLSRGAS